MDIRGDNAFVDGNARRAAQRHVLADLADHFRNMFVDRFACARKCFPAKFIEIAADANRRLRNVLNHRLKGFIARNEVGLGIDFDDNADRAGAIWLHANGDKALRRCAAGFFCGLGKAFFAQPVNRGFHVAVGFFQRGLAIHHACAGFLAQLLDHCCCNASHLVCSSYSAHGARKSDSVFKNQI